MTATTRDVVVIGITGAVGGLVARRLLDRGTRVRGLVRTASQHTAWTARGAEIDVGDLATMTVAELARLLRGAGAVVYAAGSNGGAREVTDAIDGEGVAKAVAAADVSRVRRLLLVSVMPEAWRDLDLDDDEEHYFAVKKRAEVLVSHSDLDWVILRPSLLRDEPGTGTVSLGPVQRHRQISRADVADTLVELLDEPRVRRRILELDAGTTPVRDAVHRTLAP